MQKLNQKGVAHILAILTFIILVAGLIAGLYLVQRTQIFKPKASSQDDIQWVISSGDEDNCVSIDENKNIITTCKSVKFRINVGLDGTTGVGGGSFGSNPRGGGSSNPPSQGEGSNDYVGEP